MDSRGNPRISYDGSSDNLKYAAWNGSTWQIQNVASNLGEYGGLSSLALDSFDCPHISFFDNTNYSIKYAQLVPEPSTIALLLTACISGLLWWRRRR
jgi:hypothetical protein